MDARLDLLNFSHCVSNLLTSHLSFPTTRTTPSTHRGKSKSGHPTQKCRHTTSSFFRPEQKHAGKVAVVGDEIYDSISRADVGIAIGAGTEVVFEAVDIVLVHRGAASQSGGVLPDRDQFSTGDGVRYIYVAVCRGGFYPSKDWRLPPAFTGSTMAFSSVSVVTSSLLLWLYKEPSIRNDGIIDGGGLCFCCRGGGHSTALPGRQYGLRPHRESLESLV